MQYDVPTTYTYIDAFAHFARQIFHAIVIITMIEIPGDEVFRSLSLSPLGVYAAGQNRTS